MKTCFKCSRTLPITEFYPHPMMGDGHLNKCKDCAKKDSTERRNAKLGKVREYDRMRAKRPENIERRRRYAIESRQDEVKQRAMRDSGRQWSKTNRHKKRAQLLVKRAIARGSLARKPCEHCGDKKNIQAHHEDYNFPLMVTWLCPRCHGKHHASKREYQRTQLLLTAG